jgi:hypothetical protein
MFAAIVVKPMALLVFGNGSGLPILALLSILSANIVNPKNTL